MELLPGPASKVTRYYNYTTERAVLTAPRTFMRHATFSADGTLEAIQNLLLDKELEKRQGRTKFVRNWRGRNSCGTGGQLLEGSCIFNRISP